jgi:hypothetical protein
LAEEKVLNGFRSRGPDVPALLAVAMLTKGPAQTFRVSGKLHRRRIGQKFPLPRHLCLDDPRPQMAKPSEARSRNPNDYDGADDRRAADHGAQCLPDEQHRPKCHHEEKPAEEPEASRKNDKSSNPLIRKPPDPINDSFRPRPGPRPGTASELPRPYRSRPQNPVPQIANEFDAPHPTHEAEVEGCVPVQEVAKLVRDYPLKLLAPKVVDCSLRDPDHGVILRKAR